MVRSPLALMLAVLALSSCANSGQLPQNPVKTKLRCPPPATDLVRESQRGPTLRGETGFEVSLYLVSDVRRKNDALKRALAAYKACRAT